MPRRVTSYLVESSSLSALRVWRTVSRCMVGSVMALRRVGQVQVIQPRPHHQIIIVAQFAVSTAAIEFDGRLAVLLLVGM